MRLTSNYLNGIFMFMLMMCINLKIDAQQKIEPGEIILPKLFGSNMVLQQGMANPIWGWAADKEEVTISFAGKTIKARAGSNGKWKALLPVMDYGGPYTLTLNTKEGRNSLVLSNIMVGEVWLCSGQSNMGVQVQSVNNAEQEIAAANYPKIRVFSVVTSTAQFPKDDLPAGHWVECSPATAKKFTAVGYFFGRSLHQKLKVPVGLITSCVGGTSAEGWSCSEVMGSDPDFKEKVEELHALKLDKATPARVLKKNDYPTLLFNAMINPLIPYGIKGTIWYQGESNEGRAQQYKRIFPELITDWRKHWKQGNFPFLFVSLANYRKEPVKPSESSWAEIREAQASALKLPKTGMALAIDLGDANDLHPKNKQDVGARLALNALKTAYNLNIVGSGPMFQSMDISGNKVKITFNNTGGRLQLKDSHAEIHGFAVAGKDHKFYWATAKLVNGRSVVLSADEVTEPVAVRYAWADNPGKLNLYNDEGFPAAPFRTDDWIKN